MLLECPLPPHHLLVQRLVPLLQPTGDSSPNHHVLPLAVLPVVRSISPMTNTAWPMRHWKEDRRSVDTRTSLDPSRRVATPAAASKWVSLHERHTTGGKR